MKTKEEIELLLQKKIQDCNKCFAKARNYPMSTQEYQVHFSNSMHVWGEIISLEWVLETPSDQSYLPDALIVRARKST